VNPSRGQIVTTSITTVTRRRSTVTAARSFVHAIRIRVWLSSVWDAASAFAACCLTEASRIRVALTTLPIPKAIRK